MIKAALPERAFPSLRFRGLAQEIATQAIESAHKARGGVLE